MTDHVAKENGRGSARRVHSCFGEGNFSFQVSVSGGKVHLLGTRTVVSKKALRLLR